MHQEPKERPIKSIIRQNFKFLETDFGFTVETSRTYIRVREFVLQGIVFNKSQYSYEVTLQPFVWPLIIPRDFIALSLGGRIKHRMGSFDDDMYCLNGIDHGYRTGLDHLIEKTRSEAIPYLDSSGTIAELASEAYQNQWKRFWIDCAGVDKDRCYLYAYVGDHDKFEALYQKNYHIFSTDDRDWAIRQFNQLNELRDNLQDRVALRQIFKRHIDFCIQGIKLEKFNIDSSIEKIMPDSAQG